MVSDFSELVLAYYFSSFILIFIPLLGLAVGGFTGKLTSGVSTTLGSLIGLVSGVFGLVCQRQFNLGVFANIELTHH